MDETIRTNSPSEQFERVYERLRALASRHFRGRDTAATLQATALVHEVYLRLIRQDPTLFDDGEHVLAVAATAMRHILVDRARRRKAAKRGGDWARVGFDGVAVASGVPGPDALVMNELLSRLAVLSPRQARVVEMRVFGGMTVPEVARALAVSLSTAEKDWRQARAWMRLELEREDAA